MPRFSYKAKSVEGEEKSGILEAGNKRELARILHRQGYVLISASEEGKQGRRRKFRFDIRSLFGVSSSDMVMFTRNLGVMIGAGMSLPRALRVLSDQARSRKFKLTLLGVVNDITKGESFSKSMAHYPDVFDELFRNMIKVGEESGTLEQVLKVLTKQIERRHALTSKIKGAMIYPAVIITAMMGIGALMLVMVVPKLAATFKELHVELPATTQFVMNFGSFLAKRWYVALLAIIVTVSAFYRFLKTKIGKRAFDALILKIPVISSIVRKTNTARISGTLSSLTTSGVPIVRSLEIISGSLGNFYFKRAMAEAAKKVQKGAKLSEVTKQYEGLYSPLFIPMIVVGEETGQTSTVLDRLAGFYEEQVADATKNMSSIIEPVLMILIGAAVGFFAISMIQPMYSMIGAL